MLIPDEQGVVCQLRLWCLTIAFFLLLLPLLVKTARIFLIFKQQTLQLVRLPDRFLFQGLAVLFFLPLMVLFVQLIFEEIRSDYSELLDEPTLTIFPVCTTSLAVYVLFGIAFLCVIGGSLLCWSVSETPSEFNEASHIR